MVERGESSLRELGVRVFRVRHLAQGPLAARARVQIAPEEMGRVPELRADLEEGLRAAGYDSVEVDPLGYRAPA
jgi:PP-loop superfamily ATP-utilizing enzyme